MKKCILFLIFGMSIFLAACSGGAIATEGFSYSNITPNDLNEMFLDKDFHLINVHIPFEGDLPKTDNSIPYNKIDQFFDKIFGVVIQPQQNSALHADAMVMVAFDAVSN